jgi:hypothetical protein
VRFGDKGLSEEKRSVLEGSSAYSGFVNFFTAKIIANAWFGNGLLIRRAEFDESGRGGQLGQQRCCGFRGV